ncbi:leucine--tRNA ligase [Striga asiatica]|uniref:leucine--tRNA ligase n=1 Tax=Striga asiatica TaxID=4170 RepID=A0A5A7QY14_STRAF|nr:leucine--tRNA ligase [Striga asiatica]
MAEESGRSFAQRDKLMEIESKVQKLWSEGDVFHAEPKDAKPKEGEKFYGNFPFPYMNGYLHLGHAFSLSKLEFAVAYHRLRGANVLLSFAFHCTGMLMMASADKLKREIERFGNAPIFPVVKEEEIVESPRNKMEKVGLHRILFGFMILKMKFSYGHISLMINLQCLLLFSGHGRTKVGWLWYWPRIGASAMVTSA